MHVLRSLLVAVLVAAAGLTLAVVSAAPAQAVQTDEFGLKPAGDNPRAKIEVPASGATETDAVVVYNRTNHPITVTLGLVGVDSQKAGQYAIGDRASATSERITPAATTIRLGAAQQANVPLTLATPRGTTAPQWAAVVATAGDIDTGALAVRQRLAVLVGFTPTTALVPVADGGIDWWWLLILLVVLAVTGGLWYWRKRRRDARSKGGRHGAARHTPPPARTSHRRSGRRPQPVPALNSVARSGP
ncbi:hypothetical protein ACXR2U_15795 [Jatrophihabitans sp. YIM 134969]